MAAYELIKEDHKVTIKLPSVEGVYLSSDHHFQHTNVITYCNRPYFNVQSMDLDMVLKWNDTVTPDDLVIYLGDFSLSLAPLHRVKELNGTKFLKTGNHDKCFRYKDKDRAKLPLYLEAGFADVICKDFFLEVQGETIRLDHFPYRSLEPGPHGEKYAEFRPVNDGLKLLHGHVHDYWLKKGNMVNVGVDVWSGFPASLESLLALFEKDAPDRPIWT